MRKIVTPLLNLTAALLVAACVQAAGKPTPVEPLTEAPSAETPATE